MIKRILKPILISVIQVIGVIIIHDSLNHFYPIQHKTVGFGLTVFCTGVIFILSILAFNFYLEFFKKYIYWIAFFLLITTSIFPLSAFNGRPLRSLFLILLALFGFLFSLATTKLRMKLTKKLKRSFENEGSREG